MTGDRVLACSCGCELYMIADKESGNRMESMFRQAHTGHGHNPEWPILVRGALTINPGNDSEARINKLKKGTVFG